jgi:hypothetical protein
MPVNKQDHEIDHARITRLLTHTEDLASRLDEYETKDFEVVAPTIGTDEIKIRLRHSAAQLRLLAKTLVIEIDDDRALTDPWDSIVPAYIQRHSH